MRTSVSVSIRATPDAIRSLVLDPARAGEWLPPDVRIEMLTDPPLRVGSRYRETRRVMGRMDSEEYEVTRFDPNLIEVVADGTKGTAGRGEFRIRIELEPAGGGLTQVTLTGEVTQMGCFAIPLYPVIRGVMRHHLKSDLGGLKTRLER